MRHTFLVLLFLALFLPFADAEITHDDHESIYVDPLAMEHAFLEKKIRFDYNYQNRGSFEKQDAPLNDEGESVEEGTANITTYGLIFEWALAKRFGIGIETSLRHLNAFDSKDVFGFGETEVEFKYLPWHDEERRFVVALSFGLGIPTGNEDQGLGEGRVELEPGVLWFKEYEGFVAQGQYVIATELGSGEEPTFFKYNHSFSYPIMFTNQKIFRGVIPILEVLGILPLQGKSEDQNELSLAPGFRANLPHEVSIGFGIKFPIGRHAQNEAEILATVSKHFD